ncbi:MAG TPA: DUF4365 domain-containing protein [Bacteroidia bacterium]|jgi:hypothetical protein|nr:DUF4365 domain-containing protein [Bacteroidia bacterium]
MQFPERHTNHTLEQKSENFFRQCLPSNWTVSIPNKDYGQDLNIEICENQQYRGLDLIVQLKSSEECNTLNNTERGRIKVSTYNYLWNNVRVCMLVKYIAEEDEAYWIMLKDVKPAANINQETFTIHFPRQNKLSEINWNDITAYVRGVTDQKLAAMRVQEKKSKNP